MLLLKKQSLFFGRWQLSESPSIEVQTGQRKNDI